LRLFVLVAAVVAVQARQALEVGVVVALDI
jgi:hypothetical protein